MFRRLLGPVGGPFIFFLVAALVFAGLGWVTIAALRVEDAQREAAAKADLGNNLRVAVWRLDGRMLPSLGVEDSRPFYHYSSADPLSGTTAGPTPLLAAPLPDWMQLHVQLDPATGWDSPQVLSSQAADRVSMAWPDLPLRNNTPDRAAILDTLKKKYPAHTTWELLTARDRAMPPETSPLFDPSTPSDGIVATVPPPSVAKPPPPPGMTPISIPPEKPPEAFRLLGWEFTNRDRVASNLDQEMQLPDLRQVPTPQQLANPPAVTKPPAFPPTAPPAGGAVGRAQFPLTDSERQWLEFRNRAMTNQRARMDAKNAGQEYPQYGKGFQQNSINPIGPLGNGFNQTLPNMPGVPNDRPDKDGKGKTPIPSDLDKEKAKKAEANFGYEGKSNEQFGSCPSSFLERIVSLHLDLKRRRHLEELPPPDSQKLPNPEANNASLPPGFPPRPVPPAEERPQILQNMGNQTNNMLLGPPIVNIHLGSMRPHWIIAPDGTEMLVLVRTANIDGKTVYQGVVTDWPKLEQVLKDEVKDLFPNAHLLPVRDPTSVSPDRAMTALPVQLNPGTSPSLPPAGWTPLRIGLVLAWIAALVAFAAVGFCGWSLIDLAERRFRFVSAVTHELRTPLTSLRLYLDLLMSGMIHDEAKRQEYLNTLATESDRLHRLIDNVLDFAKLEKRAKNGDMKPIRVGELLEQIQSTWADRIAADGKELIVISTLASETEICTDTAMVLQIVGNLIDNARKYTRDAEDKRIWLWAKPDHGGRVILEVEDRGVGVPPSERKTIFKPFRRGMQADAKAGGAGLGLALAKQWAEVLGGTVAYRPADGAPGACFRLELPGK